MVPEKSRSVDNLQLFAFLLMGSDLPADPEHIKTGVMLIEETTHFYENMCRKGGLSLRID